MVGLPWNTTLPQPVAQAWRHAPSRNLHAKVLNINRFRNIACAEGLSQTAQSQPHRQCVARAEFAQTWQPTANLPAHLQYEVLQWLLEMHWSMEPGALMGCLDNPSAMDQSLGTLSPVILGAIEKRLWAAIRGQPKQRMHLHEQLHSNLSSCSSRQQLQEAVLQAADAHHHWDPLPEVAMLLLRQSAAALATPDTRLALSWRTYSSSCQEWIKDLGDSHSQPGSQHAASSLPIDSALQGLDAYMHALGPWATSVFNNETLCLDAHGASLPLAALICHQNKLLFRLCTALGIEHTPASQATLLQQCPGLLHSAVRVLVDGQTREVQGYESMSAWDFKMLHYEVLLPELDVSEAYTAQLVLSGPHELLHHERVWSGYDAPALRRRLMEMQWNIGRHVAVQDLLLACPRLLAEDDAHYEAVTKPRMLHLSAVFDGQLQAHSNAGLEKRECAKSVARDLMKEA